MSSPTFISKEEDVGNDIIKTGHISMDNAIEEEKALAIANDEVTIDGTPMVTVIVDGCYSKRSYGKGYSSLSGAGTIIGFRTKKVLFSAVKNKNCMICNKHKDKAPDHKCNKNYEGP